MAQNLTYTQCGDYFIPDIRLAHTGLLYFPQMQKQRFVQDHIVEKYRFILFKEYSTHPAIFAKYLCFCVR